MAISLKNGGFATSPRALGSGPVNGGLVHQSIANGYGTTIFVGDLVKLGTDGTLQRVTTSTDKVLGVFYGLNMEGQPDFKAKKHFVAGTSATQGRTLTGLVVSDPHAVYEVQADASVTAGDVGANFKVTVGTGVAALGISTSRVHVSTRSDSAGMVKVLGLSPRSDNSWSDAYPFLLVMINEGIHQYATASVA